ncbi:MAG: hypothetical protein V7L13_00005 [Nostoc sp.]
MRKVQIGKYSISRRDLLYAFYGLVSFTTLASCGTNKTSIGNSSASNTNIKGSSSTKVVRLGY